MNSKELDMIYVENGYDNREHYLSCLAEEYGLPEDTVMAIANVYGPSEDFDGLVSALQDLIA